MLERESDRQVGEQYIHEKNKPIGIKRLSPKQEALIRERVTKLPRAERMAVYLHFWENSSLNEIAASLGIPVTLAKKLIANALVRLGDELQTLVPNCKPIVKLEVAA